MIDFRKAQAQDGGIRALRKLGGEWRAHREGFGPPLTYVGQVGKKTIRVIAFSSYGDDFDFLHRGWCTSWRAVIDETMYSGASSPALAVKRAVSEMKARLVEVETLVWPEEC